MEFLSIIIIVLVIIAILITEIEKHNTKKEMLVSFSDLYENGEYFKAITILEKLFINVEPELLFEQNELEYRDFEKIAYCYFRTNRYQVAID